MPAAQELTDGLATQFPGLHATSPEPLPFAPSLEIRSFLLARDQGNVLIYSTKGLESDAAAIGRLGGISRHYLNHGHEGLFASDWIDAPFFVHEAERGSVEDAHRVRGNFSRRHTFEEDFEVIPTPGHTPGATAYVWANGEHRFLFTGDTIYLDDGEWVAAVLASSDVGRYLESLELIRELDFDVLVPWAATRGRPFYAHTDQADSRRRIDAMLERIWRGENH